VNENGIGARLRAARERAGLTSLQAASKLHLEPRVIEALETEQFDTIGAVVYVRGHLRRYAELVGAPVGELLSLYALRSQQAVAPDLTQVPKPLAAAAPQRLAGPLVTAIVACAVIAGIWLALKGLPPAPRIAETGPASAPATNRDATTGSEMGASESAVPPAGEGVAGRAVQADPGALAAAPGDAAVLSTAPSSDAAPPPAAATNETPAPAPSPPPPSATPPPRGAATQLRFAFNADSWVEVYDARGERLYYDIGTAANAVTVSGRGPLRVLIGNVDGVALEVDGRATAVPTEVRRGDTALFVVTRNGNVAPAR
jgi:cytoskeleton protein RodZ